MSQFILNENTDFEHILGVIFNNWYVLRMAIDRGTGGTMRIMQLKISDLIKNIQEFLQKSGYKLCWSGVSDQIEDVMDVGFDVILDNFSAVDLGKHICDVYWYWNISNNGRASVINQLKTLPVTIPIQIAIMKSTSATQSQEASLSDDNDNDVEN